MDPPRLVPWLVATIASGAGLMALELQADLGWLGMGKGLAVIGKLVLLGMVPVFWEQRVALLLAVTVLAGVASHLPRELRHRQVVRIPRRPRKPA